MSVKLERMIEFLTESHVRHHGGYPYSYVICGDVLYVASLDDGKERQRTQIQKYPVVELAEWYDRAVEFIKKHRLDEKWYHTYVTADFGDWSEAFWETSQGETMA